MTTTVDEVESVSGIRPEWIYEVARRGQLMLCEVASEELGLSRALRIADDMPAPQTELERLLLLGVLFQVVLSRVTGPAPLLVRARDVATRAIEQWGRPPALLPSRAERAALIIAAHATDALHIDSVAHEIGCDVTLLRREFKGWFGMSMREYHLRARVQAVLRLIAGECGSNSDIAHAVGYESEGHFYGAVRKVTGLTPAGLRRLDPEALEALAMAIVPCGVQPRAARRPLRIVRRQTALL